MDAVAATKKGELPSPSVSAKVTIQIQQHELDNADQKTQELSKAQLKLNAEKEQREQERAEYLKMLDDRDNREYSSDGEGSIQIAGPTTFKDAQDNLTLRKWPCLVWCLLKVFKCPRSSVRCLGS